MSEVSSEAVEAAARTRYERFATTALAYVPWERRSEQVKEGFREEVREDLTAALPYLAPRADAVAPTAEEVARVLFGRANPGERWEVLLAGAHDRPFSIEARVVRTHREVAKAVLTLLASQPTVAEVREQVAREVADQREAFLSSPGLDTAWIAGWHSAVDHVAARIARGETKVGE